jgi:hypothetical protein
MPNEIINVRDPRNASVYRASRVYARKPHACSFCGRTIVKNESYGRTRDWHSSRHFDFKVCRDHILSTVASREVR